MGRRWGAGPVPTLGHVKIAQTGTESAEETFLNPFAPGFFDNPYAQYRDLREQAPVHQSPLGPWTLLRYEDCSRLLRDPSLSVEEANIADGGSARRELFAAAGYDRPDRGSLAILNLDPPDHTRIRRLASKAFTPKRVETLVPRVHALVDGLLDRVIDGPIQRAGDSDAGDSDAQLDVIADLAFPLPFAVISEMLGMPEGDRDELRGWSHTMVKSLEPMITPDDVPALIDASDHMIEHVHAAIEWKRRHPADDLLSALIAAEEEGDRLSTEELVAQVILLFIAGHETTVNLIGNGMLALLRNPDQLALLASTPELIGNAIDELLRFDSPVQFTRRVALQPFELDGNPVEPGTLIFTILGAANHDPEHFGPDADQLDLTRRNAPHHLSFGGGIHHCLGAVLARMEARIAIGTIVDRFPDITLATETPAWNGRLVLRGLDSLPVRLG